MRRRALLIKGSAFFLGGLAASLFCWLLLPETGRSEGISGYVDLNYNRIDSKTESAAGSATNTQTDTFFQQYRLNFDRTLYPNLRIRAGGLFGETTSTIHSGESETKTTLTKISPLVDLSLNASLFQAGVGYNRMEEKQDSLDTVRNNYTAFFGYRPDGLPTFDLQYLRTSTYDKERISQDTTTDHFLISSLYQPAKGVDLRYMGSYTSTKDQLQDTTTTDVINSGRATYNGQFFNNRVSVFSSYNIARQDTRTSGASVAGLNFQAVPVAGLFALNDDPTTGVLSPTDPAAAALVDGNLTAGTGINIGRGLSAAGDTRYRNMGFDFGTELDIHAIYLWTDRDILSIYATDPGTFRWDIYISSNNLDWTLYQSYTSAGFGPFDRRFAINFPTVRTRYIKLVTRPFSLSVPAGIDMDTIFVTEVQAFAFTTSGETSNKLTVTSQIYDLTLRTRLLDSPSLFYDLYYWYSTSSNAATARYILSNGFSVSHRFNRVFSAGARIAREDARDTQDQRVSYVYNASLTATPLVTLSHTLIVSGREEEIGGKPSSTRSVFLNNSAELYRGVSVNLSGGVSDTKSETGEETLSTLLTFGANIVPHPAMTITLGYSDTDSKRSGGDKESTSKYTRRGDVAVAYTPFRTMYFFAGVGLLAEQDRELSITQNYSGTWSPFRDGALQFTITYNENLRSDDNGKDTLITPSVRWNITRRAYLDVSYQIVKSTSTAERTEYSSFNTSLKMSF